MSENGVPDAVLEKTIIDQAMEASSDGMEGQSGAVSEQVAKPGGVLHRIISVSDQENYLQTLLLGNFLSCEEADHCSAAIAEAQRYGLSIQPILAWVVSRCAVNPKREDQGSRAILAAHTLAKYTVTPSNNGKPSNKAMEEKKISGM